MRWKGIVSHVGQSTITPSHTLESATQPMSRRLGVTQPVARMTNGFDPGGRPELLPQPAHADVDHVRARIEAVSPHLREQPLAADDLARVRDEVVEEPELAI